MDIGRPLERKRVFPLVEPKTPAKEEPAKTAPIEPQKEPVKEPTP